MHTKYDFKQLQDNGKAEGTGHVAEILEQWGDVVTLQSLHEMADTTTGGAQIMGVNPHLTEIVSGSRCTRRFFYWTN